jgi:hypothetical protein
VGGVILGVGTVVVALLLPSSRRTSRAAEETEGHEEAEMCELSAGGRAR